MSDLKERAEAHLDAEVKPCTVEHTPYGEIYHNAIPLQLSPVDLGILNDQAAMMRVIAGLQDSLGPDEETEEEANDFEWDEPDALATPHTIREVVEEEPLDPTPQTPPAVPAEPTPSDEGGK